MRKMERNAIFEWAKGLSDEELENAYYDLVFSSLGSEAEDMYERGYDMADIREQEEYEKYLGEKTDILGQLCEERGIRLWEDEKPAETSRDVDALIADAVDKSTKTDNNIISKSDVAFVKH